jgi:hypothetical protein
VAEPRIIRAVMAVRQACRRHPLSLGLLAVAFFLIVFVPAIVRYDRLHLHTDPMLLAVIVVVAPPLIVGLNAVEFILIARLTGHAVTPREAAAVSIGGSMANLLPIPGAAVLRSATLVSAGRTLGSTLQAVVKVGGVWVGVTAVAYGSVAAPANALLGGTIAAGGLLVVAGCLVMIHRQVADPDVAIPLMARVVAVEVGTVALEAVRLLAILHAIGAHAGFQAALALASANVLSNIAGIFPAGLGLREALSAAFGAASGLPAAVAITATVVDRFVVLIGLGSLSLLMVMWNRRRAPRRPSSMPPTL